MKNAKLIFVLALVFAAGCVSQGQYDQQVQETQQLAYLNSVYQQLNQALEAEVAADQVQIQQLQDELQVTLVNEILFAGGRVGAALTGTPDARSNRARASAGAG